MMRSFLIGLVALFFLSSVRAADPVPADAGATKKVSYFKDVRPLFQQHCLGCHQPAKAMGGYQMTTYADLLKKSDRDKPGVVPSHPEQSFLLEEIHLVNGKAEMPKNREPLAPFQIQLVRDWITQGAIDDTPKSTAVPVDAGHPPTYQAAPVITALAYSPDSTLLAVSGYHEVLLHKADGSGLVARLIGLSERVQNIAFSPDGKLLAVSGGSPGRFGEVQIWDVAKQKLKQSIPVTFDTIYGISWSHDGTKLAFGCGDNTLRAIDANTGQQILFQGAHSDWVLATTFSVDSSYVVSVSRDRSMKLTEVATQRFIDNVTSITPGALKGGLSTVDRRPQKTSKMSAVPPDAPGTPPKPYDELLIGGSDGVPRLYKMHREAKRVIGDDANKVREYAALPGRIYSAVFNADGSLFVVGSSLDGQGQVRVYQTDDAKLVSTFEQLPTAIYATAFRPDNKMAASGGFDGMVRLHDPMTGKLITAFQPAPLTPTPK